MIGLLIWLSAFALTNITARPVAEPYDWYTPSTDAISTDNYPSAGSSFTEAATFKQEEPNDEEPNIDPAEKNLRDALKKLLDAIYEGRYVQADVNRMYGEEYEKWVAAQLDRAFKKKEKEARAAEDSQGETQPFTDGESLSFKSINQDELVKFVEISETMAPQYGIGLKGIELTEAIILAIPAFVGGLIGGWHPVGL